MITKPTEPNGWLDKYIQYVQEESLIEGLKVQTKKSLELFSSLQEDQLLFRYAEGKWNIKEIIVHLMDTERVFGYRALRFARHDQTELPGYDENLYAANSHASERTINNLLEEYIIVRTSTVALFTNLREEKLANRGIANGVSMSVAALGFAILGHEIHHLRVIDERYLRMMNMAAAN